jgi:hypothetical protein
MCVDRKPGWGEAELERRRKNDLEEVRLWNVLHFLGGIEKRRHKIVTSPDWTGTTFAGRGEMVTPGSVGTPGERAKISSVGVDPAGTVRRNSAPASDGAQYRRAHSCVRNL